MDGTGQVRHPCIAHHRMYFTLTCLSTLIIGIMYAICPVIPPLRQLTAQAWSLFRYNSLDSLSLSLSGSVDYG